MKKIDFLRLVCAELARMGVEEDEIKIQCINIDRYLKSMGIGEESPVLDSENPVAFAKLIFSNIAKKQRVQSAESDIGEEKEANLDSDRSENDFSEDMPNVDSLEEAPVAEDVPLEDLAETDDVKIFEGSRIHSIPEIDETNESEISVREEPDLPTEKAYEEEYNPFEEEDAALPETVNGTIEFDVSTLKKKIPSKSAPLKEEEDYFEKADEEDYKPSGNPVLFWVLVCLTSFLWIPLGILFFVGIGLGIVLMILFEALYIPGLVGIIIGGAAISFAELIYSIIKFADKNPAVAFFELGLGFLVAALTVGLPSGMYYLGVSVFPCWIRNYGKNIKKLMKKLRRLYRKLKGACSI